MDIREEHNLARLFFGAFALLNRCGGALLGWLIAAGLIFAAEIFLAWVGVTPILIKLANFFVSAYLGVALLRIFGAKAEQTDETVSNSFSASVFPAFYQIIFNILYGAVWFVVIFALVFLFKDKLTELSMLLITQTATASNYVSAAFLFLLAAAIPFYVGARLLYAPAAIALRDQGPIQAIIYSIQLTAGKRLFTALGALILICFLPFVYITGVLYGGYTLIPLYFADSFHLASLSPAWWGVFAALGLGYLLLLLALPAFLVLVFLNQDYGHNRDSFTPQAELKITSQTNQVFGENNNILPPGVGNLVTPQDVQGIQVTKSSVKAVTDDGVTEQHLQEVYQPKPEDLVQYSEEEDRMPTILFDDEMARQIEQERTRWQAKQQQDKAKKGEDDAPSVKMSK